MGEEAFDVAWEAFRLPGACRMTRACGKGSGLEGCLAERAASDERSSARSAADGATAAANVAGACPAPRSFVSTCECAGLVYSHQLASCRV